MNSFLSTTFDREIALVFVPSEHDDDLCPVLFEIYAHSRSAYGTKPFADISTHSQFVCEREILFMTATIFRLVDIRRKDQVIIIQMELCTGDYDNDTKLLFEHMKNTTKAYHECLSLGLILYDAGMCDKAELFYKRMLNELANDHPLIAALWGLIGSVKRAKGELEISSEWLNKSLKRYEEMGDRLGVAKTLQNLGNVHQMKGELNQAFDKYTQALNIVQRSSGYQNNLVAVCLHNLGMIYFEQHKFTEALKCYADALKIRESILPQTHPDFAREFNNLGKICFAIGKCDRALEYFDRALEIFRISLPSEHPSVATTYYNMGLAYCSESDFQRSLIFLNRAASIHRNTVSPNHPDIRRCLDSIAYVKQKQFN